MALLGKLGILERAVVGLEIGAGILPVAVEEEIVELAREIVVMGDVVLGLADRIVLVDALQHLAKAIGRLRDFRQGMRLGILHQDRKQIVDGALRQLEAAVHVAFAKVEVGVRRDLGRGRWRCNAHAHRSSGSVAILPDPSIGIGDAERARLHDYFQCVIEKSVHIVLPRLAAALLAVKPHPGTVAVLLTKV